MVRIMSVVFNKQTLIFIFLFSNQLFCQSLTDIARSNSLTWYGVDFTLVRFIGFDYKELADFDIIGWSFTTLSAEDEGMIRRSYGKENLLVETYTAMRRNQQVDCRNLITRHTYQINPEDLKGVVKEYAIYGDGYGVILIVESVEKIHNSIFIWVVYIDRATGNIISSRRYIGGGYGGKGKNYSEGGVKLVIKLSGKDLKLYK